MPSEHAQQALEILRDPAQFQWYVIPLLAIVMYIYVSEINSRRWNVVFCGLAFWGADWVNEILNSIFFHVNGFAPLWGAPGDTAYLILAGLNIEIMFMFAISGIIYANTISEDRRERILGIPNWWFWAIGYSVFCVFVEVLLNMGGLLVWEYPFWHRSFQGVWLIFFFGYFHFYVAALLVIGMKTIRAKAITVAALYAIAITANIFGMGIMGWVY